MKLNVKSHGCQEGKTEILADGGFTNMTSIRFPALLVAFFLGGASIAFAQTALPMYGTTASPTFTPFPRVPGLAPLPIPIPAMSFTNANYGTGGVALRNRGAGNIGVSGVVGPVKAAFIYWAVIEPNNDANFIHVQRLFPTPVSADVTLTGTVVGVGPQPCWIGSIITVYRAAIPLNIATGNGSYQVTLLVGASGSRDGGDPWAVPPVLPLWEGASIVMVGTGTGTVNLFDVGLAGTTFVPPFSYTLNLTGFTAAATPVQWDNIGADGQVGAGRTAIASISGETTTINGVLVAGPGSAFNLTGDWNGSSGFPLPQLWDDTGNEFTIPSTNTLSITFGPATGQSDCLTPVANVVQF